MMFRTEQDETNDAEWQNPDNWSGPDFPAVYFSKKDSRIWVPKKNPRAGWTINLAHDAGAKWLIACIILPILLVIGVSVLVLLFLLQY